MNRTTIPGPRLGQESLSKPGSFQNDTSKRRKFVPPLTDSDRLLVLTSIANRWALLGLDASPAAAMIAMLGGVA
jgi:hypothetical protein